MQMMYGVSAMYVKELGCGFGVLLLGGDAGPEEVHSAEAAADCSSGFYQCAPQGDT